MLIPIARRIVDGVHAIAALHLVFALFFKREHG
jgi:hypothetical protein